MDSVVETFSFPRIRPVRSHPGPRVAPVGAADRVHGVVVHDVHDATHDGAPSIDSTCGRGRGRPGDSSCRFVGTWVVMLNG